MAAYAALASLINNIEQMMKHPHLCNSFDKRLIQSLLEKSSLLIDIVEGNKYGEGSKEAEDFERQITCAAHAAEDIIETHIVDRIHVGYVEENLSIMVDLQRIIEDMEALKGKADEIFKIEREEQPTISTLPVESGEPVTAMVGLEDELTHLLDELTDHQPNRHTISIVGMGGIGKTTLARNIFKNSLIIERFDIRAWATVSQQYNEKEILSQLLSSIEKLTSGSVGELGERLYKGLIGRRYLVILDDIWSVEAWDKVRHYFPNDGSSSRVLLTTRLSNVASACGSTCFTMNLLDEGKSWELFCEKTLFPHKDFPVELEDVGKDIVRSCKGLALSIVVIGGLLLKSPRTIGYWEDVAKNLKSIPDSEEKQQSLDVLYYRQLPAYLKPCFLYMGSFKEDSEIRVSTVTKLWVAEGFIRPNGTRILEEIAHDRLKDLIDRNLILVSKRRSNGEIGACGIHDLLRDLCVKVAEEQDFFHVREYGEIQSTYRRIICDPHDKYIRSRLARSILTRKFGAGSIKCKLLRVLGDAEDKFDHSRGDVLYRNVNLRYLAYKNLLGTQVPTSITLMWNLQTLIFFPNALSNQLSVAPSEIWKVRQLRHIKFWKLYLHSPSNEEDHVLENFQTLATAVNLRLSEKVCKIIPNIKKLGLLYDPNLQGYDDSLLECLCNLSLLPKLESLNLRMDLVDWEMCESLKLKNLAFPDSLRKLSLRGCQLHWNDLETIGSLPRLQALHLYDSSITEGEQWSPSDGQFCHLKFLMIHMCELHQWKADNSHFPVLQKLVLIGLPLLEEIPMDIGDIPTLELIRVEHCSLSAAISAMKIKEYQQDMNNDSIQVQIKIANSEVESFMEMVETEQLMLNSIQFESY